MAPCAAADPLALRVTRLEILPLQATVEVAAGQSLLEAALGAGIRLASTCRNGTCRACIARVLQGRVHHRIEWPGLSADERDEGWVLPCVAVPESDVVLWQEGARRL